MITYGVTHLMNLQLWNLPFNPIDYVLKPFMIIPFTYIFIRLLINWTTYTWNRLKQLRFVYNGKFIFKVVEKRLPIYMIDESYLNKGYHINGNIIVDMRIKNTGNQLFKDDIDVVKLYNKNNHINIRNLIEKANLIIRDTAYKGKAITFLIDSKEERNRMVANIWLRLICNPHSKSTKGDIDTILNLVY
ncbi:hypothetical protein ACM26V_19140 [Salipaludibacillus sp. HK11]|uniref:hypothetical protein n=1 Tax=Salipaludibacillus sp. HK11 TaxID=3394320 RepID=UPI0039FD3F04